MSSTKSLLSTASDNATQEDVERMGYLKKMKTMKKKFFVLRREGAKFPARLEYYDTEKKFKSGQPPKRSIVLKKCFNINRRVDTRVKHCLALYTKDDCFCIVLESAEDAADWLKSLLELQHGGATEPGEVPKPAFEFVWQVKVQEKGLGATYNILGQYRVCLTAKSLSLLKMGCKDETEEEKHTYEFSLASIRRCGSSQCFFYMEVGRSSMTGAGELWMVTEDQHIATHMHNAIITAMSGGNKGGSTSGVNAMEHEEMGPKPRNRSCSYNEASKPVGIQRRVTHATDSGYISSTTATTVPISDSTTSLLSSHTASPAAVDHNIGVGGSGSRERCDSLPCAPRTRTTSEGLSLPTGSAPHHPRVLGHHSVHHNFLSPAVRPHSMYARGMSYSPPIDCSPVSPVSGGCSTDSAGSSLSIDETDGSINWLENLHQHHITRSLTDSVGGSTPPSRCCLDNGRYAPQLLSPDDSIPGSILEENSPSDYLLWATNISEEEQQEYMPMDRQSSANLTLPLSSSTRSTNNNNNNNKYKPASPSQSSYLDMSSPVGTSPLDTAGRYMLMSPGTDVTPQAAAPSSFPRSSGMYISAGGAGYSSAAGSANHSRTSSLAEDTAIGYVPMGPSQPSASHDYQRETQDTSQAGHHDEFVIHRDDGYVDMDHSRGESPGGSSCSLTSGTPSMTNTGEHSHHFSSEFHLEKVSSYFTPSEDDEDGGSGTSGSLPRQQDGPQPRPTRAYSLGSRPDSITARRNRLDVIQQEGSVPSRARACSMGAQQRPMMPRTPAQPRHHSPVAMTANVARKQRASTGPFLSSSWSGSSSNNTGGRIPRRFQPSRNHPHASLEPITTDANLMELDFSTTKPKNLSSDYLDMGDKVPTSPIFEEYVDMRKTSSKPIDLPKKSSILPLWGSSSSSRHDIERVSPNRGNNSSDDYLNMKGTHRGVSQPINIATNQSNTGKSSTSPVMFSLSGLLSRKSSSGAGTPPKLPDRSNSPSPFSSLRRRGKKSSKKNKDKRSSISSDDASNVTTPVGVFPFSPSTPSKSFVPEEQFAKCSIDSGGVRLAETGEDVVDSSLPPTPHHSYANYAPTPDPEFIARLKADAENISNSKRKVSSALRPPILGQSCGKTVVIGQEHKTGRQRNSTSECEYVPMHPSSSHRKYSDISGYNVESNSLLLDRKCASDNVLLESTNNSDYTLMTTDRIHRRLESEDYAIMKPGDGKVEDYNSLKSQEMMMGLSQDYASMTIGSQDNDDYADMKPGQDYSSDGQEDYAVMSIKTDRSLSLQSSGDYGCVNSASLPREINKPNDDYALMQPASSIKSTSNNEDYALMMPGIANTPPKIIKVNNTTIEQKSNSEDYALMTPGISKTPPKSFLPSNLTTTTTTQSIAPIERKLETLKEHVDCGDYALLDPQKTKQDYAKIAATPLKSKLEPKASSSKESTQSNSSNAIDDYALMIPGDGQTSPRLLENQTIIIKKEENKSSQTSNQGNSDYALMKPGEGIIEYESSFKCVQPIEADSGDYATLTPTSKGFKSEDSDYALMTPGKSTSEDKSIKDKKNIEQKSNIKITELRKSPARNSEDADEYVLMTPAIKPQMLPTPQTPISLHLNNPSTAQSPLVVSPLLTTSTVVPDSTISSSSSSYSSVVPNNNNQVPITPVTIIPSLSVTTRSNPIVTRSSSIPLPTTKPMQTPPIHIPKAKNSQQQQQQQPLTKSKSSTLSKSINKTSVVNAAFTRHQQQACKPKSVNKTTTNKPPVNNKQPLNKQINKTVVRRSTSKSPLPTTPAELNYASLDLPQSQEIDDVTPTLARNLSSDSSGESDVTSVGTTYAGTTYAQIDFVRTQQQQQQTQQQQSSKKVPERKS